MGKTLLSAAALALLGACSSQPAQSDEQPALIARATPEGLEELQKLVGEALGASQVTLAEDSLTRKSTLIIERNPPRTIEQRPLQGRNMEMPEKFSLLLGGDRCWLQREADGERWEVLESACVPAGG